MLGKKQKLVYVQGEGSFLFIGDNTEGVKGDDALPVLLEAGWEIKSINLMSSPHQVHGCPAGYVLLEKQ